MKQNLLLAVLFLGLGFKAQAEEKVLTSMVSRHSFPLKANEKPKSVVCISNEWSDSDLVIGSLMKKLAADEAKASVFETTTHTCYDQVKISDPGKEILVKLMNKINDLSDSKITTPVEVSNHGDQSDPTVKCANLSQLASVKTLNSNPSAEIKFDGLRNEDKPIIKRFMRGTTIIQGGQVLGLGILMVMPTEVTNWESPVSPKAAQNFKDAWTKKPVWDKDRWEINFIGHPLSGAGYYNAVRSQGVSPLAGFVFSTAQSLVWEYGFEAINERPSIQDMLFTSTIGSVMGEGFHQATMKMRKNGFNTLEKIVVTIINPMFVLNNGYKTKKKVH